MKKSMKLAVNVQAIACIALIAFSFLPSVSAANLRALEVSFFQKGASDSEQPIPDPTCTRGLASPDLKICCTDDCGICGNHALCNDPGKFHEVTGKLVDNCCKDRILKAAVSCDKNHPPCVLPDSYLKTLNTYTEDLPKRHAMQDCNKAVPSTYASHELAVDKGEALARIYTDGRTKYEAADAIAAKVNGLCEDKTQDSKKLIAEYSAKIASATPADNVKDPLSGQSNVQKWKDAVDAEHAEIKFYDQLIGNAKTVAGDAETGLGNVETLKAAIMSAKDLDHALKVKLTALIADANKVYDEAQLLWKQWEDSSKDYNCGAPAAIGHATDQCKDGNTKYSRKCKVVCATGYDGNQSANSLRCNRQGKFGKQLYGEWMGMATCIGRMCGKPANISKAKTVIQDIRYPHVANYICYEGYSTTGKASGPKTFSVQCGATGSFLKNMSHACQAISCGSAPPEKNTEPVKGTYHYTDVVTYKCKHGFTVDETPGGLKEFAVSCQATGVFNKGLSCLPVRCGPPPDFEHTKDPKSKVDQYFGMQSQFDCRPGYSLDRTPAGKTHFALECSANGEFEAVGSSGKVPVPKCQAVSAGTPAKVPFGSFDQREMFFGDTALVTADSGYSITGSPTDGLSFIISVTAAGTFSGIEKFIPVSCGAPPKINHGKSRSSVSASYPDKISYDCDAGYSTDKTASRAAKEFTIQCEAEAQFSKAATCANINDCLDHTCGPHGDCVDHLMNYTCSCDHGYAPHWDKNTSELVCGNINDCGPSACGVGKCIDLVGGYKCDCPTGYEQIDLPASNGKTEKTCKAVICGVPPSVDNAATTPISAGSEKASYSEKVTYRCDVGHTIDGTASGKSDFEIECQATKKFTDKEECKPIKCDKVPTVAHASAKATSATFNNSVRFDCDKGHTVDASAQGDKGFTVTCQASGAFGLPQECKPVSCGVPDDIANSFRPSDSMKYEDTVTYTCNGGFTLDGTPDGKTEFTVDCLSDGTLTKTKQCLPKVCGTVDDINVLFGTGKDQGAIKYPQSAEIMCLDGYTVGGDAQGNASFTIRCTQAGKFERYDKRECQPVVCVPPPPMANATLKEVLNDKEKAGLKSPLNFEKKAVYECLPGFTAGGEPDAPNNFNVECLPSGDLSAPSPDMQCRNVNDCEQHTCGPKGSCIDLIGPSPAYTCNCSFGYVIQTNSKGEKFCGNKDDCKGNGCGVGVCKDLIGDYTCICPSGYYIGIQSGKKTCVPVKCADDAPTLPNGKMLSTRSGEVLFPESVRYECDKGYSTDGSVLASKTKFHALCKSDGALFGMMSCQKITCGTPHVLPYTSLASPSSPRKSIEYDDKAKYKCKQGYTVGGNAGAATEFDVTCQANGILSSPKVCEPVKCGLAPRVPKSKPGIAGNVFYGMHLVYACDIGYTLDSTIFGANDFERPCLETGKFTDLAIAQPCKPISGGVAPSITNAVMAEYDGKPVDISKPPTVYYPKGVEYRCLPGYSTTGTAFGPTKVTARVNSMGFFEPALPSECKRIGFSITAVVKNARSGITLDGVAVSIEGTNHRTTSAGGGYFSFSGVAPGSAKLIYEKTGVIKTERIIDVTGDIGVGGVADIAMSPTMAADEWRVVLKWGAEPLDLDSYAFWGWSKVCWYQREQRSMDLQGTLEQDRVNGYGPETVYLKNVGKCSGSGEMAGEYCDITYQVNDYTESGTMLQKGAEVTLYNGNRVAGHWKISECAKSVYDEGNWWEVFSISGATNQLKWNCRQSQMLLQEPEGTNKTLAHTENITDGHKLASKIHKPKKSLIARSRKN